jgi:hypothetical protein
MADEQNCELRSAVKSSRTVWCGIRFLKIHNFGIVLFI